MNFVTGGTGLVGSHLLFDLLRKGENVLALKRKSSDLDSVKRVFQFLAPDETSLFEKITWVNGDVRDIYSLEDPIKDARFVYHSAAVVSFHKKKINLMNQINVEGTANLVNACLDNSIEKLCHVSSTAALGRTKSGQEITERSEWKDSKLNTHYAITKYESEMEVWRGVEEGLNAVIVNPSIIIGPGQEGRSSGAIFSTVARGLPYFPQGSNAFVAASDVSKACIELMASQINNERFLVSAENRTYQDAFEKIAQSLNVKVPQKEVQKWMLKVAWIWEGLKEKFGGSEASITRESIVSAGNTVYYDSDKIKNDLNFKFRNVDEAIDEVSQFLKSLP